MDPPDFSPPAERRLKMKPKLNLSVIPVLFVLCGLLFTACSTVETKVTTETERALASRSIASVQNNKATSFLAEMNEASTRRAQVQSNIFTQWLKDKPLEMFTQLRTEKPIYRLPNGAYLVTRYEDVLGVLSAPAVFKAEYATQSREMISQSEEQKVKSLMTKIAGDAIQLAPKPALTINNYSMFGRVEVVGALAGWASEQFYSSYFGQKKHDLKALELTETSTANALDVFFSHAELLEEAVRAATANDDELLSRYVQEALRFHPAYQVIERKTQVKTTLGKGTSDEMEIEKGATIMVAIQSAMNDDTVVKSPNVFKLDRPEGQYFNFGYGPTQDLAEWVSQLQVVQILKPLLLKRNLRRAPGESGLIRTARDGNAAQELFVDYDLH